MDKDQTVVFAILYCLVAFNLMFVVVLYAMKIQQVKKRKVMKRFEQKLKDYVHYILANLDSAEPLKVPPYPMNGIEKQVLLERLIDLIETLAGEQRDKLIRLCGRLGFINDQLERLESRSFRKKISAAYYLGCMRVREAAPKLLKMLRKTKFGSPLFVIARAMAKCSQDPEQIKQMIRIVLSHKKNNVELVADIVKEAEIDHAALFLELIQETDPVRIQIGLTGLSSYSSVFVPKQVVRTLLEHPNRKIRFKTIQMLSSLGSAAYVDMLQKGLEDTDPSVVQASAAGCMGLGQEGMAVFCETAKKVRDQGNGTYLQDLIEEELKRLSSGLDNLETLGVYNTLKYTYEKTFGKTKRMYRVV